MKTYLVVIAFLCALVHGAHAGIVTGTFHGTVSALTGTTERVRIGDPFAGVLRFDPGYDYGYRIDSESARFIWNAWDYQGPPPAPLPLPVFIGLQNLRTGERFDVPPPGVDYDYGLSVPPYAGVAFDTESWGQQLTFTSFFSYYLLATLTLGGEEKAFFDEVFPEMIDTLEGAAIPARSSVNYASDYPYGFVFDVALSDFRFGPAAQAIAEPAGLALAMAGLLALWALRRRGPSLP